jgi:SAM-dependent methyltransferase
MRKPISRIVETLKLIFRPYPEIKINVDYNEYWTAKRGKNLGLLSDFQKERTNIILKHLENNSSIKDIGCGDGAILKYIYKYMKFLRIYGVDVSDIVLGHISKMGIIPVKLDINNLNEIKNLPKTDYTLILEVLEHLQNSEEVLLELLNTTEKKLIFSVPNTGFIGHRLRLLFGSFPLQWRTNPGEHLRFWTYGDIKWWLKELKLYNNSTIYLYEGIPLLNKIFPSLFAMGILVVIEKEKTNK